MAGNFLLSYMRTLKNQQDEQVQICKIFWTLSIIEFEAEKTSTIFDETRNFLNNHKFLWTIQPWRPNITCIQLTSLGCSTAGSKSSLTTDKGDGQPLISVPDEPDAWGQNNHFA